MVVGARTGPRFYYAHLDRWAIAGATRVREGDVIGYVGNTGNARTTPSHLHFGVYDDGAIDPMPFLYSVPRLAPRLRRCRDQPVYVPSRMARYDANVHDRDGEITLPDYGLQETTR